MRTVDQVWQAPPLQVWTAAFADRVVGKRVPWQAGDEGGWGAVTAVVLLDGGVSARVTVEVDDTMMDPPF